MDIMVGVAAKRERFVVAVGALRALEATLRLLLYHEAVFAGAPLPQPICLPLP